MSSNTGLTMAALAELGARRVSVGSAFARAAWVGFIRAASMLAHEGSFAGLDGAIPFPELNDFFRQDWKEQRNPSR
jgi:2-methylisocitrate lyase-like PEP mutase family enzyme